MDDVTVLHSGGGTNSRPALTSEHGIDTVRLRWREDNLVYRSFQRRPEGCVEGYRGELWVKTELGRVGAFPDGTVYFEGRAGALDSRSPDDHSLLPPGRLHSAERAARTLVRAAGAPVSDRAARLGRVDLAGELRFASGPEGTAFLHALGSLDVAWAKVGMEGRKGADLETVYLRGVRGRTVLARAYDKGVEAGTHRAGERIRFERQLRFRRAREMHVAAFVAGDLRSRFLGRELGRLVELHDVVVCDVVAAIEQLGALPLGARERESLTGFLVWGNRLDYAGATYRRRKARLRQLGIHVDPARAQRLVVPVGRHLEALASAWQAAA